MKERQLKEEEFPYDVLSEFGLTREMIEDLPVAVLDDITAGNITPVLPIKMRVDDENIVHAKSRANESNPSSFEDCRVQPRLSVHAKSRFALKRGTDGVKVLFYPVLEKAPIEQFSEEQQSQLKEGKAIMAEIIRDGEEVMSFVQIDPYTNQVMSVPSPVIGRNLQVIADEVNLSGAEINVLKNGEPLTILVDDELTNEARADGQARLDSALQGGRRPTGQLVTIGVDLLNSGTGIRIEDGDAQQWRNNSKREWDKYTFGLNGCWVADDNGDLSYVAEDDYSEELWNEMKKKGGMQNSPKR